MKGAWLPAPSMPETQPRGSRMLRPRILGLVLLTVIGLGAGPLRAQGDGYIGIYADAAGTTPCTTVPPLSGTTLYVIAKLQGASASGISGAEFRIEVENPTGWSFNYTPPSAPVVIGNALDLYPQDPNDGSGVSIAFDACREPTGGQASMGTITVINFTGGPNHLFVKRHSTPRNPGYQCALFTLCDDPEFSKTCMILNVAPPCSLTTSKTSLKSTEADSPVFTASVNSVAAPGPPSQALVISETALPAHHYWVDPWSPSQPWIALFGSDGVYVYDATAPGLTPNRVYQGSATAYRWSPDGRWLVVRTGETSDGLASLVVVRANAVETPAILASKVDFVHFVWAGDGNIYCWEYLGPTRRQFAPPSAWQAENPGPFSVRTITIFVRDFSVPKPSLVKDRVPCRFNTQLSPVEALLTPLVGHSIIPQDGFPDAERLLVSAFQPNGGRSTTLVVDSQGTPQVTLGSSHAPFHFEGTSVSPGGAFVAGHETLEDEYDIVSSRLTLVEISNAWQLTVVNVPEGLDPKLSRVGSYIAYADLQGVVYVGTLEFN